MKQYLDLVRTVLAQGVWQENRTGIRALSLPGLSMRFDLQLGFPAITTRKLAFKSAIAEMIGFIRSYRNAADFRALGCKVWDQNANDNEEWLSNPYRLGEDDMGNVYGVQWRQWPAYKVIPTKEPAQIADAISRGFRVVTRFTEEGCGEAVLLYKAIDQLRYCLDTLVTNPANRRILFHGWNWAQLDQMALPPCHLLYQFVPSVATRELSLCLYVRSNDLGLGTAFNLAASAALLHLVGRLSGFTPRWLSYFIGDAHIYENHLPMLEEQLKRSPFPSPKLVLSDRIPEYTLTQRYEPEWLERVEPSDFRLDGYQHHPALSAPMAV